MKTTTPTEKPTGFDFVVRETALHALYATSLCGRATLGFNVTHSQANGDRSYNFTVRQQGREYGASIIVTSDIIARGLTTRVVTPEDINRTIGLIVGQHLAEARA